MEGEFYSIGHGSRRLHDFIEILDKYKIALLVDVRVKPYTYNSAFNRPSLQRILGPRYTWMGDKLGGLSNHKRPDYKEGLQRLIELKKRGNLCIMCAELNPAHCHREYWIARDLRAMGIKVHHIAADGSLIKSSQKYLL